MQENSTEKLRVKIKRLHKNSVLPSYAKCGDAGMDLTITSEEYIHKREFVNEDYHIKYGFGISIEIPEGYVGLIFPRSSIYKQTQLLSNSVGVIDSGYRGEISAVMKGADMNRYKVGDRAAQLIIMPYPQIEFEEVEELSESERGEGGYGSTGN